MPKWREDCENRHSDHHLPVCFLCRVSSGNALIRQSSEPIDPWTTRCIDYVPDVFRRHCLTCDHKVDESVFKGIKEAVK